VLNIVESRNGSGADEVVTVAVGASASSPPLLLLLLQLMLPRARPSNGALLIEEQIVCTAVKS